MSSTTPTKERFLLQHVWKTGGTEFCYLARANGWTTPPTHNCFLNVNHGWPKADYDMVANERPMMVIKNRIQVHFKNRTEDELEVDNVKWITILRHPYSRSLSHYYHMYSYNRTKFFSLSEFLTVNSPPYSYFHKYIPNQQTRWHCGSAQCGSLPRIGPTHLTEAMINLDQFHVVLILEDMKEPDSCTRLQMRHVLNLTKVEVLEDLHKTNKSQYLANRLFRRPSANWYQQVMPHIDDRGHTDGDNGTSAWGQGPQVMAALGLNNDLDLQLYGYARKLCTEKGIAIKNKLAADAAAAETQVLMKESGTVAGEPPRPPLEIQHQHHLQLRSQQSQQLLLSQNDTLWSPAPIVTWNDSEAQSPSVAMLQVSSLVIISLWMLMLPSIRRLRFKIRTA